MNGSSLSAVICSAIGPRGLATMIVGGSSLFLGACSPRSEPAVSPPQAQQSPASQSITGPEFKQRQIAFLNRIRDADPQQRVIDRAMLNEQNELGLILDRSVEMNRIPDLMRALLTQMAREFPEQDLTVIAYTPSSPPQKVGTAHLDSRTKDMNYLPEY
jgi:hypothetical protein